MDNFYDALALHYDTMQSDMDVEAWAKYIGGLIGRFAPARDVPVKITDLGCGTGSVDIPLAKQGYEVTGIDSAEQMLMVANFKEGSEDIIWSCQDIVGFEIPEKTDCFLLLLDTINHITDEAALAEVFRNCYENLNDGGLMIFDCITEKHLSETLGDNIFYEDYDDFTLLWVNEFDKDTRINTAYLTLFTLEEDGRYERFDGELTEKLYDENFILKLAENAGFEHKGTFGELKYEEAGEGEERVFFVFAKGENQ